MRKVRKVHAPICLPFYIGFIFNSCYFTLKISSIVYILFQTFVAQKFGFAAEIQALQGSPNDKDIIDLCGHYGLGMTAVNAAMRRRYAAKTAGA